MRRLLKLILPLIMAVVGIGALGAAARGASSGVIDGGKFFSKDAVAKAEALIRDIHAADHRDVLVVTYDAVPPFQEDDMRAKGRQRFFEDWVDKIGLDQGVNGVVILMLKNPGHLQIGVGNQTRQHSFTLNDRDELNGRMLQLLRSKQYDEALLEGLQFIKEQMKPAPAGSSAAQSSTAPPVYPNVSNRNTGTSSGFSVGGLVCLGVAILVVVVIVMGIANRNRGYGSGYGAPPPGGYPPGYSGGYPQGGGYYGGGGGGGFGRGLLGGLLGGALGAWGYDRFSRGNTYQPPATGGSSTGGDFGASSTPNDTSYSSTGGDFDSGPSSSSTGGDFGSSADSGGAGSDFGGGGGDFGGGGGGDFGGGGGDSGSSSGGDF